MFVNRFLSIIAAISIAQGAQIDDQTNFDQDAGKYLNDYRTMAGYEIAASLFSIFQVYLQTTFMFNCLSLAHPASKDVQDSSYRWLKQVLLYLIPMNGVFWIVDSFTIINLKTLHSLPAAYFSSESYQLVSHLLFPFSLFYRFNSCLTCIKLYFDV